MPALLHRRVAGILSALFVATTAVFGLALPAQAVDGYQYWNYFHLQNDTWEFAKTGPAQFKPEDGAVEGLRYGVSTASKGVEPRADLAKVNFETVCGDADASEGEKRVAVLLDYGTELGNGTPPEPQAECAVVAEDATTMQVLDEVADVRVDSEMVCGIDGYPAKGCGEPVKDAEAPANEQPVAFALPADSGTSEASATSEEDGGMQWPLVGVGALVVVVGGGAFALSRRNKAA